MKCFESLTNDRQSSASLFSDCFDCFPFTFCKKWKLIDLKYHFRWLTNKYMFTIQKLWLLRSSSNYFYCLNTMGGFPVCCRVSYGTLWWGRPSSWPGRLCRPSSCPGHTCGWSRLTRSCRRSWSISPRPATSQSIPRPGAAGRLCCHGSSSPEFCCQTAATPAPSSLRLKFGIWNVFISIFSPLTDLTWGTGRGSLREGHSWPP